MANPEPGGLNRKRSEDRESLLRDSRELQPDLTAGSAAGRMFAPVGTVKPHDFGSMTTGVGLKTSVDLGSLDDGLRDLAARHTDVKVARLLDQARRKVEQGKFQSALTVIDQALSITPVNAEAWLLQARGHFGLGRHERALASLTAAREHTEDPATMALVARVRTACEDAVVEQLQEEVGRLLHDDATAEALEVVDRAALVLPDHPAPRYFKAVVLLLLDRPADALEAVEAAVGGLPDDEAVPDAFTDLRQRILAALHQPQLEEIRRCLRARDPKGALRALEECPEELRQDGQFAVLWSYARERYADGVKLPWTRRKRRRESTSSVLNPLRRQEILLWLLGPELDAGRTALLKERFTEAIRVFQAAALIDNRCGTVRYLHAIAEFREAVDSDHRGSDDSDLRSINARLSAASALLDGLESDPLIGGEAAEAAEVVERNHAVVRRVLLVTSCVDDMRMILDRYSRGPIRTRPELDTAIAHLERIKSKAREISQRTQDLTENDKEALDWVIATADRNLEKLY
ncbi:MAG: tetratricopeptide repeat protein [Umezawaea sp.]